MFTKYVLEMSCITSSTNVSARRKHYSSFNCLQNRLRPSEWDRVRCTEPNRYLLTSIHSFSRARQIWLVRRMKLCKTFKTACGSDANEIAIVIRREQQGPSYLLLLRKTLEPSAGSLLFGFIECFNAEHSKKPDRIQWSLKRLAHPDRDTLHWPPGHHQGYKESDKIRR